MPETPAQILDRLIDDTYGSGVAPPSGDRLVAALHTISINITDPYNPTLIERTN